MVTEIEAKVTVGESFEMPVLDDLRGVEVVVLPSRDLHSSYYDTRELVLARWGVTLRFRTGEPGEGWTLKFPRRDYGAVVDRDELGFAGRPEVIPGEVRDLVRVFVGARPLVNVAQLHTLRRPLQLRTVQGVVVVEVVDDWVDVQRLGGGVAVDLVEELDELR